MAGLAYIYQGQQISFDDPEYNDPHFGTCRMDMRVGSTTVKHGFTSDVTASQYCSLKFRLNSTQTARIGRQRTRSRVSSEAEHTESWSGTGYVSTTEVVEEVIGDRTIWTGRISSQGKWTTSYESFDWNNRSATFSTLKTEPAQELTTSYLSNTTSTSMSETYKTGWSTRVDGYQIWYRSALESHTNYYNSNSTGTFYTYTMVITKLSSASRTQNGQLQGSYSRITTSGMTTFDVFETTIQPQHTLTHTATFETLHNYNL